jgi:hypothetical protein
MRRSNNFEAYLHGSIFIQSRLPIIVAWTQRHSNLLTWSEHRTLSGAKRSAKTHSGGIYQFNPFVRDGAIWEAVR